MQVIQGGKQEGGSYQESPTGTAQEDAVTFVILSLAEETFAVSVDMVKEIVRVPDITWVPGSKDPVKGVINLRGSIVPVVHLPTVLGLASRERSPDTRIIVVDAESGMIGMVVDSVKEVVDIPTDALEPIMQTLSESQRLFVQAQTNYNDMLVGILDMDRIIGTIGSSNDKA